MLVLQYVLGGALILMALALVVLVLLQSSKDKRLSGTISGGSSDTYYGQNKGRDRDKILSRITLVVAILFVAVLVTAYVLIARQA